MARWLSMVPQELRLARPDIEALHGIMSGTSGRAVEAEDSFRQILSDPTTDEDIGWWHPRDPRVPADPLTNVEIAAHFYVRSALSRRT